MIGKIENIIKKYRLYGWPVLSVLASLLLIFFVIVPGFIDYFKVNNSVSATNDQINNLNAKASVLSSVNITTYQDDLNSTLAVLPQTPDTPLVISQVQNLVSQSGLQLNSLQLGAPAADSGTGQSGAQTYEVKVDVLGSQDNLTTFFNKLNDGPLIMKVDSLSVSSSSDNSIDATLSLKTFYESLPAVLGDVNKPVEDLTPSEQTLLQKIRTEVSSTAITSSSTNLPPRGKTNPFQ